MSQSRVLLSLLAAIAVQTVQAAGPQPASIELAGVVRDFKRAHPDFDVMPIGGPGHYAGNVDIPISSSDVPVFGGSGFKVDAQWQTASSHPLAPHMFVAAGMAPGVVQVANSPSVHNNATEDTWDSSAGPYTPGGPEPVYQVGAPMPDISAPTGLGPSEGSVTLNDETVSTDRHFDDLTINGTVQISGNRVIYCEGDFTLATWSNVELLPGATLDLYATGSIVLSMPHCNFNAPPNSGMPGLATVYNLGTEQMRVGQPNSVVYATVIAPWAEMRVMPNSEFFGNFIGQDLDVKANAGFHIDMNVTPGTTVCGVLLNDSAGSAGVVSDAAVTSSTTFAQWYREILGVNMAASHSITLTDNGSGVYEYLDAEFYPIDAQLFGNEGDAHNNYFTYTIDADFVYTGCTAQFIEFMGADDAWIYIDGSMVIDLGGIAAATDQRIDLDRLGLVDGEEYTMQLFFAHRAEGSSQFNLRTNVELGNDEVVVTASLPCD